MIIDLFQSLCKWDTEVLVRVVTDSLQSKVAAKGEG